MEPTRIVIAAGGTAGHVAPALAVANALRADGAQVTFIGGARAEAQMVPAAGYELRTIAVEGVSRTHPVRAMRALARATWAVPKARGILRELRPNAVLGGGGYVTAPVGLAALSLRIPLVLTEADSHLGLANRLLAHSARCVCLALPISGRQERAKAGRDRRDQRSRADSERADAERADSEASRAQGGWASPWPAKRRVGRARYRVTGRPIPVPDADRTRARERFGIGEGKTCVLVFGGSLGARSINLAAVEAFTAHAAEHDLAGGVAGKASTGHATAEHDLAGRVGGEEPTGHATAEHDLAGGVGGEEPTGHATAEHDLAGRVGGDLHVLHISGRRDYAELRGRELPAGYDLREYLDLDEFAQALAAADLVVARAGGSVAEIAAYGKPAILVPYPHASADHQSANARWLAEAGAAVVVADGELTATRLGSEVQALLADPERMARMALAAKGLARPNAASEVAEELLRAAGCRVGRVSGGDAGGTAETGRDTIAGVDDSPGADMTMDVDGAGVDGSPGRR